QLGDELSFSWTVIGASRVLFETFEQGGKAGAAADGDDTYPAGGAAPDLLCVRRHRISLTFPGFRTRRRGISRFRIEQFSEAGIVRHVLKVRVVPRLKA